MTAPLALLPEYLTAHLQLTLLALGLGIATSVPLGVLLTRSPHLQRPVLAAVSVIQTIPGLALLAVMVPLLAALGLPSIGFLPAIIGLTLYSLLPVLRNTVTGIAAVDPALIEAARGVGMSPAQQLRLVELPLALPVIVAGIRTSAVWTVGMATLSTPVGATSLGNFIFAGLQTRSFTAVLVGSVAAAALALLLDGVVGSLEASVRGRSRRGTLLGVAVLALLCGYAAFTGLPGLLGGERPVRIGAKTFTEQYVLAEILAGQIRQRTGLSTEVLASLGSTVAFDALRGGEIDVYVDYCGTLWATILRRPDVPASREACRDDVERFLREEHGIELVAPLGFENAYALAMRRRDAVERGIRTIGHLAPHAPRFRMGSDYEFLSRPEWRALVERYGLRFAEERSMDPALMYQAAAQGDVDVISAFTTDGRLDALDLVVLVDERRAIPPYDALIFAGPRITHEHPPVIAALRELEDAISASHMRDMNAAVDSRGESPASVARHFLASRARLRAPPSPGARS